MKKSCAFIALFVLIAGFGHAQKVTGVRFSYFIPAVEDTFRAGGAPKMIKAGGYEGYLVQENFVSENPKTAAKLIALVKNLKANGTGVYQEVFDTVDYDNKSGADVVDILLDGMDAVGYTVE